MLLINAIEKICILYINDFDTILIKIIAIKGIYLLGNKSVPFTPPCVLITPL